MPGGIIQIVAKGPENLYLNSDPQITLFKTVYRRHSNFAKIEQNLTFNHKLNFGSLASCKLKHFGDLIGRILLVIDLPEIKLTYYSLTNKQLQTLLKKYDIIWTYDAGKDDIKVTYDEYTQVVGEIVYISFKPNSIDPSDTDVTYVSDNGTTYETANEERMIEIITNIITVNNYPYPMSGDTLTHDELIQLEKKINNTKVRLTNGMILDKINSLLRTIQKDDQFIIELEKLTNKYETDGNTNVEQFVDELMLILLYTSRELSMDDQEYIDNYDYYNQYNYLYSYKNDYSTILPRPIVWIETTNDIIRYIDAQDGIPQAQDITENNRFICAVSDRGWIDDNVYKFVNSTWVTTTPQIYNGNIITEGYTNMGLNKLYECIGWSESFSVNGFYDPNLTRKITQTSNTSFSGPPNNPKVGDTYISLDNAIEPSPPDPDWVSYRQWKTNEMWRCIEEGSESYNSVWQQVDAPIGAAVYVRGGESFYKRMIFKDSNGQWFELVSTDKRMKIMYDGTTWRKSVKSFWDPTNTLPTSPKIGDKFISTKTINNSNYNWYQNHIYTWTGWSGLSNDMTLTTPACTNGWIDTVPTTNYSVNIEKGTVLPDPDYPEIQTVDCIVKYDSINETWTQIDVNIPMYTWSTFLKLLYSTIRNQIFTDNNVKLLYGIEYCNTTVLPSYASRQMRSFFDEIVSNTIQIGMSDITNVIDTSTTLWKFVYNPFFTEKDPFSGVSIGESFVGSYANLTDVQSKLVSRMRYFIKNEIIPDINMFNTLFSRLYYYETHANIPNDDYFKFIYYKQYQQSGNYYVTENAFYNCPKNIYERDLVQVSLLSNEPLQDYFLSKIKQVTIPSGYLTDSGYITTEIIPVTETLLGVPSINTTDPQINGKLYDHIQNNELISSFFNNFFTYTSTNRDTRDKYNEVKNNILVHSNLINKNTVFINPVISFYVGIAKPSAIPNGLRYICNCTTVPGWVNTRVYESLNNDWVESIPAVNNLSYLSSSDSDCVVKFDGISWIPQTTLFSVTDEHNPSSTLPPYELGKRYISTNTSHGWLQNYIYECVDVSVWITEKYVITFYNPTGTLPLNPKEGDAYISTATGNGWTINHIYTYNGTGWDHIIPTNGDKVYVKNIGDTHKNDAIESYDGVNWSVLYLKPTLYEHDPSHGIPPIKVGIKYISTSTSNGWILNYVYEGSNVLSWAKTVPQIFDSVLINKTNTIKQFGGTSWNLITTLPDVLSYYDPSAGTPSPSNGNRYISSATGNGWIKNKIYEYNSTISNNWMETTAYQNDVVFMENSNAYVYFNGNYWYSIAVATSSVLSQFDPTNGLPSTPTFGDKYISLVTANTWVKDMIYMYNDVSWVKIIPQLNDTIYVKNTDTIIKFNGTWVTSTIMLPVIQRWDSTNGLPLNPTIGDRYISANSSTSWNNFNVYEWNGTIWTSIMSFYDPTNSLPLSPTNGDTYLSLATANDWQINYEYTWNGSTWLETSSTPKICYTVVDNQILTFDVFIPDWVKYDITTSVIQYCDPLVNIPITTNNGDKYISLRNGWKINNVYNWNNTSWVPIIQFYDPTYNLPMSPIIGDKYVSLVTANTWISNYNYEWNGTQWTESIPSPKTCFDENLNHNFYFSVISNGWVTLDDDIQIISRWDPSIGLPSSPITNDKYISIGTTNGWVVHNVYSWDGSTWVSIISFFDPTNGLPTLPNVGDKYTSLSTVTAYGWTIDYNYEWNGSAWIETIPIPKICYDTTSHERLYFSVITSGWITCDNVINIIQQRNSMEGLPVSPTQGDKYISSTNGFVKNNVYNWNNSISIWEPFISFYDPSNQLPISPTSGDTYLSLATANNWKINYKYTWNGSIWRESYPVPQICKITENYEIVIFNIFDQAWETISNNISVTTIQNTQIVIKQFDPSSSLPLSPQIGDSYVSMATANSWTINYIYKWNGVSWIGTSPVNNDMVYMSDPTFNIVKVYLAGVGYTWTTYIPPKSSKIYTKQDNNIREYNGMVWNIYNPNKSPMQIVQTVIKQYDPISGAPPSPNIGDRYVSMSTNNNIIMSTNNRWLVNYIYEWNGSIWTEINPLTVKIVYMTDPLFKTVKIYNHGTDYTWVPYNPPIGSCIHTQSDNTILRFDGTGWYDSGIPTVRSVLKEYDPIYGLPIVPTNGDTYISLSTTNGWTINNIYTWDGSMWSEDVPLIDDKVYLLDIDFNIVKIFSSVSGYAWKTFTQTIGYEIYTSSDDIIRRYDGLTWIINTEATIQCVIEEYNPINGKPSSTTIGDKYISKATANGWNINNIYEWNGSSWFEILPNDNDLIYIQNPVYNTVKIFTSGTGYGWSCYTPQNEYKLYANNKTIKFNGTKWINFDIPQIQSVISKYDPTLGLPFAPTDGDKYISTSTANSWIINYMYEYMNLSWIETPPEPNSIIHIISTDVIQICTTSSDHMYSNDAWISYTPSPTTQISIPYDGTRREYDGVNWNVIINQIQTIIKHYDPTPGLPNLPVLGDSYISLVSANGWTSNYMYTFNGNDWSEVIPYINTVVLIQNTSDESNKIKIYTTGSEFSWITNTPVIGTQMYTPHNSTVIQYDGSVWIPVGTIVQIRTVSEHNPIILPNNPQIGDSYVSTGTNTINGWIINNIYVWDGIQWVETIPTIGQLLYVSSTVKIFTIGSGYTWNIYTPSTGFKIYTPTDNKIREYSGVTWIDSSIISIQNVKNQYNPDDGLPTLPSVEDSYISMMTSNGWKVNQIYTWDGTYWIESNKNINTILYLSDVSKTKIYSSGTGHGWLSYTPVKESTYYASKVNKIFKYCGYSWSDATLFYVQNENIVYRYNLWNNWVMTNPFNYDTIYNPNLTEGIVRKFNGVWMTYIDKPKYQTYNTCECLNLLSHTDVGNLNQPSYANIINDQIFYLYRRFFYNLRSSLSLGYAKGDDWGMQLNRIINWIHSSIRTSILNMVLPNYLWDGFTNDGVNAIYDTIKTNSSDILSLFIFKYYSTYDVHKVLPSDIEQIVPDEYFNDLTLKSKNAIEFLALTYQKNLEGYINSGYSLGVNPLTETEKNALTFKIRRISSAYTGADEIYNGITYYGLKSFDQYIINNNSNISQNEVPELYYIGTIAGIDYDNPPDTFLGTPGLNDGYLPDVKWYDPETNKYYFRKHRPYDILSAVVCYVMNQMKISYNAYYTNTSNGVMLPSIYDTMGNPFKKVISLIPSSFSEDYYVDGNELYANIISLVNDTFGLFTNGLKTYYTYQNLLNVKNMNINKILYKYASTLEMLIQFHKEIYNNQEHYVGGNTDAYVEIFGSPAPTVSYVDTFNFIILQCFQALEPLLAFYNTGNGIYSSPIDILYISSSNRKTYTQNNPYKIDLQKIIIDPVISLYTKTTLPTNPSINDRYIYNGITASWTHNYIYQWNGSVWTEIIPIKYMQSFVITLNASVKYDDTAWISAWNDSYEWYNESVITNTHSILNLETINDNTTLFSPNGIGIFEFFTQKINESSNPFMVNSYLYNWYNSLDPSKKQTEVDKMYKLFGLPYSRPLNNTTTINAYAITPQSLYYDESNITSNYDNFISNKNFLTYLMDHLLKFSSVGNVQSLIKPTIEDTYNAFVQYYKDEKNACINLIDNISPYVVENVYTNVSAKGIPYKRTKLEDQIDNMYYNTTPRFAWIQEIGHYIIQYIKLKIGDEVIDLHTGEYLHINTEIKQKSNIKKGYNKMIGNIEELYTFDNTIKHKYRLFIPLQHTFCDNYQSSLPLICLNNTAVTIEVQLKDLSDVAYWDSSTKFIQKPSLNCQLIADYILLDMDERKQIATHKQEMLIETTQYNGDIFINLSEITKIKDYETYKEIKSFYDPTNGLPPTPIIDDTYICSKTANGWYDKHLYTWTGKIWFDLAPSVGDRIILKDSNIDPKPLLSYDGNLWINVNESPYQTFPLRLGFVGLSKELIFVVQTKEKIDGTLPNGEKKWNDYLADIPIGQTFINNKYITEYKRVNPIASMEIRFNGRERENTKDIKFYNLLQRYAHHTSTSYDGINVYSFALNPEDIQPSGTANFSQIENIDFYITFIPQLARLIDSNKKLIRIGVYNKSSNILRIMSGMAGLAFYP